MFVNKINNKKYIGQARNFLKRYRSHVSESMNIKTERRKYNSAFHNAIRKYGIENFEIIILKENLKTQCLMNFWECYYIDKYDTLANNKNGYNISNGGSHGNNFEGKSIEEMKEIKIKMREAQLGEKNHNYGKRLSEETKKKISEAHKGIVTYYPTEEQKKKRSEVCKEKCKRGKNHYKSKQVTQYDMDGTLIKEWDSIREASKTLKINLTSIWKCCKNRQKTAGGFIWKYKKED